MKREVAWIAGAIAVAIFLLAAWRLWPAKETPTRGTTKRPTQITPSTPVAPSSAPSKTDPKAQKIEAIMDDRNAKSLDFYGQIIDQNGHPVEKVKITAKVGFFLGIAQSGGKDYDTESDSAGKFSFTGIHGAGTGFILQKEGYIYDQRLPSSSRPNDYIPDPGNPAIFRMWKLKGAEQMIHYNMQSKISCDGSPNYYNLQAGRRLPNGNDFTVELRRNPLNIDRGKPFDWSVILKSSNGGLVKIADVYPNEALAEGYQPSITINMPANVPNWTSSVTESYYFYNGSDYGRITISITANFQPPPTLFDAEIYMNPSGSRNLEFDPAKQINK